MSFNRNIPLNEMRAAIFLLLISGFSMQEKQKRPFSVKNANVIAFPALMRRFHLIACVFFRPGALSSNDPPLSLCPDLLGAAEEVLPSLQKQGSRVFILREHCDVEGIESLSDKIQQESDEPLSPHLRASVTLKSPALYIYTSGTTGNPAFTSDLTL